MSKTTVTVTRRFDAAAERVFDAFLDPARAGQFLFKSPEGEMVRCEIDARVGGRYTITERREDGDVDHFGEYLEIDRPRRLVFTLQVPKYAQEIDTIAVDIVPSGSGCELTLTHEMELPEWAEQTEQGWTMILGNLEKALSSADPR